jgi:hypothetical protein
MESSSSNVSFRLLRAIVPLFVILQSNGAAAFGIPKALIFSHAAKAAVLASSSVLPALVVDDSTTSANVVLVLASSTMPSWLISEAEGGALDILRTIAIAITAVVFLLAGITLVTASVVMPAAAKELEKECLELSPELWAEYQAKLDPRQTIDQRPELMQEIGEKLQPLLDAKIARAQRGEDTTPSNTGQWDDTAASFVAVDAEIVSEDKATDEPKTS